MINITSQKGFIHPPSLRWWQWLLGNRTQKITTSNGTAQTSNTPVKAGTNQYQNYQYDGSGKMLNDGVRSYVYNSEGRIERIQNGSVGVVNGYNALGQRVQKNSGNSKIYFSYDEQGKLIGEYEPQGNPIREYVYLSNAPISLVTHEKAGQVLSIHSDHLGTPRAILGANSEVLWRWEGEAFGADSPSVASVKMPLRFAGQYADDESGLFYNYFRFYDPKTGRYVENDPIDLAGGLNRWGYVGGSPLGYVDPYGQFSIATGAAVGSAIGAGIGGAIGAVFCSPSGPGLLACSAGGAFMGAQAGAMIGAAMGERPSIIPNTRVKDEYCSDDPRCEDLEKKVRAAKDNLGNKYRGKRSVCEPRMSYNQLKERSQDWLRLAQARAQRDQVCFAGGNPNEQDAQQIAWNQVSKCQQLMKQSF